MKGEGGKTGRRTQKCTLYQKKHIDRYRFPPCGFHRPEICSRLQKGGFSVKLNNFKFIYSERREPLPEMTRHQYSGWEHVLSQTARHRLLVPAQSPSAATEWRRRRGWRGQQRKHLYPNWWSFMTALFVKVRTEWLCYTQFVTFLGALNIMTHHPVPARYIAGGNISSCSLLRSSATWALSSRSGWTRKPGCY